jgi:hypothetical protein
MVEVFWVVTLKLETVWSHEPLVSYQNITGCHSPQELDVELRRRENFKSRFQVYMAAN